MRKSSAKQVSQQEARAISDATLRQFVGYHVKRASNVIQGDLAKVLKPFDLRMLTYTALVLIVDNPGLSQSQLADAMDIERPNLVVVVDELEQNELIMRERVPTDRRTYALKATLAGRQVYDRAVAAVKAHEEALLAKVEPQARAQMIAALNSIRIEA